MISLPDRQTSVATTLPARLLAEWRSPFLDTDASMAAAWLTADRIPKSDVEIRRASSVASADGHHLEHVDGFVVDPDDHITQLVLERGHLCGRRWVMIPIGAVARVETDAIALSLTRDEVGVLPEVRVQRLPAPGLRVC